MATKLRVKGVTFDHWHTLNYARLDKGSEGLNRLIFRGAARNNLTLDRDEFLNRMKETESILERKRKKTSRAVTIHENFNRAITSMGFVLQKEAADKIVYRAISSFVESQLVVTYPGTRDTIRELASKYPLGLISNTPPARLTCAVLEKSGLLQYFSVIALSAQLGWVKPHKKIFQHALLGLKLKPSHVVHTGDISAEDIVGAKSVGMKAVHVARYEKPSKLADGWISSLRQLSRILRI